MGLGPQAYHRLAGSCTCNVCDMFKTIQGDLRRELLVVEVCRQVTCEMLMKEPLDPAVTMRTTLLVSGRLP